MVLTCAASVLDFNTMGCWTINPSRLFVLMSLLFLVALILVLPEVDLPDTAFHSGTTPLDVHSQATSAPVLLSVGAVLPFSFLSHTASRRREQSLVFAHVTSSFLPLLHRSLRC